MEDIESKTVEIQFGGNCIEIDFEIANKILNAFKWHWKVPTDKVQVKVENRWITLDGRLQWQYQKDVAQKLVGNIAGVKGVTNNITVKADVKTILVQVSGHETRIGGIGDSLQRNDELEYKSRNTHGFWIVDNELVIEYND